MTTKKAIITEAKKAAIIRFIRVIVPQIPAFVAVVGEQTKYLKFLPAWVVPTLMLVGAIFTALDKFLRDIKAY